MLDQIIYNREIHHRRSVRLKAHDYSQPGAYFLTICTWNKECLFGKIVDGEMRVNEYGRVVQDEWSRTAVLRPNIILDAFIVMPNHCHGIVVITGPSKGVLQYAPTTHAASLRSPSQTIGAIVRGFKSAATRRINILRCVSGVPVWQRNYYERVVRDDTEMHRTREYITSNPAGWLEDEENPVRHS